MYSRMRLFGSFLLLLFIAIGGFAQDLEKSIVLGKEDNWRDIESSSKVIIVPGLQGFTDLVLAPAEYEADDTTDLLLHFNSIPFTDSAHNYLVSITSPQIHPTLARYGDGAALFQKGYSPVTLKPGAASLFSSGATWDDFTIEFWLYSPNLREGDVIFLWKGAAWLPNGEINHQEIKCSLQSQRLNWDLNGLFQLPGKAPLSLSIGGSRVLIPRSWSHHLLRFSSETGLLEYLIDGKPEAVAYANPDNRETGIVYIPRIGSAAPGNLTIGTDLTAIIDEFRISRSFVDSPNLHNVSQQTGFVESRIFDLTYTGTMIDTISAVEQLPGNTDIAYFYRLSDAHPSAVPDLPWVPFIPGKPFPATAKGRYLQLRMEFYPEGTGSVSPRISTLTISYFPDLPPTTPIRLEATGNDKSVTLRWIPVPEQDVKGYLVYYGTKPGVYFGTTAVEGQSPIDAGNTTEFTIHGLTNGTLYYFSGVAYDNANPPHRSSFSNEISTRPSRMLR